MTTLGGEEGRSEIETRKDDSGPNDSDESWNSTGNRRSFRSRFSERQLYAAGLAVLPIAVLVVMQTMPYNRLNNGDPFIYVGYSNNFRPMIERFGYTYHAVRFTVIFPLKLSTMAFGPFWGYFVLRYVLYLVAIIPLYLVLARYGRRIGILGAVLFVANPVTAAAILSSQSDMIIVPVFTAMTCVFVLAARADRRQTLFLGLVSGVAAGVGLHANVFFGQLLVISGMVCVVTLFFTERRVVSIYFGLLYSLGVALVTAAGVITYHSAFGDGDIWTTTIQASRDIKGNPLWEGDYWGWVANRRFIYVPLLVFAFAGAVLKKRWHATREFRTDQVILAGVAVGCVAYFVFYDFVLKGSALEVSYYFAYVMGPTVALLAAAAGWSGGFVHERRSTLVIVPIAVVLVCQAFAIRPFLIYIAGAAALTWVIVNAIPRFAAIALLVAVGLSWGAAPRTFSYPEGAGFQFEPHYERQFGDIDDTGFETYLLASQLPSVVPNEGTPLLFWYASGDPMLDSVQATYHWQTSTVQRSPVGMPEITPDDRTRLVTLVGGHVVLLARSAPELSQGIRSLTDAGYTVEPDPIPHTLMAGDSKMFVRSVRVLGVPATS